MSIKKKIFKAKVNKIGEVFELTDLEVETFPVVDPYNTWSDEHYAMANCLWQEDIVDKIKKDLERCSYNY